LKLPSLITSINFGAYYKQLNKMGHFIGSTWNYKSTITKPGTTLSYTPNSTLPITTQCNITLEFQYDSISTLCKAISNCNLSTLKAKYCSADNTPVVCETDYHYGKIKFRSKL